MLNGKRLLAEANTHDSHVAFTQGYENDIRRSYSANSLQSFYLISAP